MSIDEEDVSIEIPADQAEKPADPDAIPEKPPEKAQTAASDTPDELADLKNQLAMAKQGQQDERKRAHAYEMQAREAAEARKSAESQYADSRLGTISSAIDAEEARATNAQRVYRDAMAQGDFDAASTAQREMARAEARLLMLSQGKEELETPSKRTTEGRVQAEAADPVETLARQLSIQSAQWVRAHPEAANDVNALSAAHSAAIHLDRVKVDTPEYFAAVEKHLGMTQPTPPSEAPPAPAAEPGRRSVSAPVGGSSSSSRSNGGGNIVTLTGLEREHARVLFDDKPAAEAERLYAINKAVLIKEGKYDKAG